MTSDPRTTPAVLDRIAAELPDAPAVLDTDRRLSYADLRTEVRRAAAALIAAGVRPGDRVAIWSPNTWHWVVAALGIHYAGAVMVPLNTRYTAAEATDILARTETPLLFAAGRFLGADRAGDLDPAALPALRTIVRVPVEADDGTWAAFLAGGSAVAEAEVDARAAQVGADDVADILFTSGTTGRSKGVLCAHRQSLAGAAAWAACGQMRSDDRYLAINPFFHNFGYKAGILACLQTGAALIPAITFDPVAAMSTVAEQRVTVLPGPPTIYQMLLDHPRRGEFDLTSLRFAVTGAATVPVVLIERMQSELDIDVVLTAYGLTEASGFGTMCRPDDDAVTVATTCGRPIADFELALHAETSEVLLRGPNVMLGYLDDPAATDAAIDADGWLHTGDVGTLDAAGNLAITDRLKDMYICGGFNVYPAEIEQVLTRLPGVADVAVIGVPDARLGEVGRAFVVAAPGADLDEATVIDYAKQHLANFKTPRSVAFLSTLPRNPGGKVVKPQLREMT
ncbi:fatty acid--CoA ligase [Mycolicibacillus koreensis]|nr:fatty acid--CoA ligase [Mycolicibacillus koreensis]